MNTKTINFKQSRPLMGTVITVEIADQTAEQAIFAEVFDCLTRVEEKFSVFKESSEISLINQKKLQPSAWSPEMKEIFKLAEETKKASGGFFNILANDGTYNPSGLVKGWAISRAAKILSAGGYHNFYVEAGGDIEARGRNRQGELWSVGIKNPFNQDEIVKVVYLNNRAIATSGTYIRGRHIYNPYDRAEKLDDIVSLSVIGPNAYEADRFATAAFAMGKRGIAFIDSLPGFEGYLISREGLATLTRGFEKYLIKQNV